MGRLIHTMRQYTDPNVFMPNIASTSRARQKALLKFRFELKDVLTQQDGDRT